MKKRKESLRSEEDNSSMLSSRMKRDEAGLRPFCQHKRPELKRKSDFQWGKKNLARQKDKVLQRTFLFRQNVPTVKFNLIIW